MNVRMFLCVVLLFVRLAAAEESSILSRATDAWRKGDSETALKLIKPALDGSDRELHELYQHIEIHHEREPALVQMYQKRLAKDKSPMAYYLLVRITSDFVEKERLLQEGLGTAPNDRFLVREWARCLYRQGKWANAEKALLAALEAWPIDVEVYSIYFTTLERLGRLDEGIAKFREWAVEFPNDVFRQVMAYRCLEDDLPEEAHEFLDRAIALDAEHLVVLLSRCEVAIDRQDHRELMACLTSWKEREPWGRYLMLSGMVDVLMNGDRAQGFEKFHLFTRLEPLFPSGWARTAHAHAMLGQFEQAREKGERALALQPISPQVFHTLGFVAVNEERFEDGIRCFEAVLANGRPSVVDLRNLSRCYKELGDHEKAKACLERAEALSDEASAQEATVLIDRSGALVIEDEKQGHSEGLCQLGRLLAEEGKLDEARAKFLEAAREDPDRAESHWNLALLEQMGFRDLDKAISHWEAARKRLSKDGGHGFLTRKLALAHYRQGRVERAIEVLSGFISEHGADVEENDPTVRLHEQMTRGAGKSVRLPDIRARQSTEDDYCLSQSLATILDYWKLPNDVIQIGSFIGDKRYLGQALRYLDSRDQDVGYKCFSPNETAVKALVDAGFPVMVGGHFLPRGADNYMGHATVVAGYDEMLEQVLVEDSNWFQGWEMLPYELLPELRAVVIAPPDKLAALMIELPDQEYHKQVNRLEPLFMDVGSSAVSEASEKGLLALPDGEDRDERKLLPPTEEKAGVATPEELDQLIRLQPNHWYGHFLAGMAAKCEDDRFAAVKHLKRAAETSSRNALPHLFVAAAYDADEVTVEARDWLRQALEREPELTLARRYLIQLLFDPQRTANDVATRLQYLSRRRSIKSNLEEAATESVRYLKGNPEDEDVLLALLLCELKLGRFKDGEQTARKLIKVANKVETHLWLAISLENQGRMEEANEAATAGMKLASDQRTRQIFQRLIDMNSKTEAE